MTYDHFKHHRRTIRLNDHDYSDPGIYFITIRTMCQGTWFGEIISGKMQLNEAGWMIKRIWQSLPQRFPCITIDESMIMPDHFHGLIVIKFNQKNRIEDEINVHQGNLRDSLPTGTATNSVGRVIQAFKSISTHEYIIGTNNRGWPSFPGKLWRRDYYDRIIRDTEELDRIRDYIRNNPRKWANNE
jgi:putative transposase